MLSTAAALRFEPWRATHAGSFTPSFCAPAFQPAASSPTRLPRHYRRGTLVRMTAISIHELHENTDLWVRKSTEQEPIVLTDKGRAVAKIVPVPVANAENPFLTRKLLPGFAELQAKLSGGTDSAQIISDMRDGR